MHIPYSHVWWQGLDERGVNVNNFIVNQLISDSTDAKFVERVVKSQGTFISDVTHSYVLHDSFICDLTH